MNTTKQISKIVLVALISTSMVSSRANASGASTVATTAAEIAGVAAITSLATGTALKIPCTALPKNPIACVMMGLALAQMALSLANQKNSKKSAEQLSGGVSSTTPGDGSSGTDGSGTGSSGTSTASGSTDNSISIPSTEQTVANLNSAGLGALVSDYRSLQATADDSGFAISKDGSTVTVPGGKQTPTGSFGSSDSMKNAGFGASDIANYDSALKEAAKSGEYKSKLASLTNADGGSGGGGGGSGAGAGSGSGDGSDGSGSGYDSLGRKLGLNGKGDKGLAGMSKKLGTDNIGVSGDNIFEMVHRRYEAKDKANAFIKN